VKIERLESLDALETEWEARADASGNGFATPEFLRIWWRHFGGGRTLATAAVRAEGGRLAALLPIFVERAGSELRARFVGAPDGDQLGPVHAASDQALALEGLRRHVHALGVDTFVAEHVPPDESPRGRVLLREASPVLPFRGRSWDELLGGWSSNLREQVGRRERKLRREHDIRIRLVEDPAGLDAGLAELFRLHRLRWGVKQTEFDSRRHFHVDLARAMLERGRLRLWLLEADGDNVAAWYGFRYQGAEFYYQMGRDPAWDRASVGFILLAHTLRAAATDGLREYRFLRGDEPYKYRFAEENPGVLTVEAQIQ